MRSRLKQVYRQTLPVAYAITFENRFNKTAGILFFENKKDADYLYKIADHVQCRTALMKNSSAAEILDMTLDIYDYGLIRIDQQIKKAIHKSNFSNDIMYINNQEYNIQPFGDQSIITYIKEM